MSELTEALEDAALTFEQLATGFEKRDDAASPIIQLTANALRLKAKTLRSAIEALAEPAAVRAALEAEWYNGNLDEAAYHRLLAVVEAADHPHIWPAPDPRPPDLYAAIQVVRAYLGLVTPEQIDAEEARRLEALDAQGR